MKKIALSLFLVCSFLLTAQNFTYESYKNDPTGLRLYTLDNGMKVYLAKNQDEPKIQAFIAVKAGSTYDPKDNTGLAHYLEHMVFKGTDEIGTSNWEVEKVILQQISDLYEAHKKEQDPEKKKAIYKQIDEMSYKASQISIANEYDKMISSLGAEGTNAHTWHEETIYKNKIPSNELDKWLTIEQERFSQLVLRLFHTELEAVYEEFNRAQDNDYRKVNYTLMDALFPKHPYGQQTTIGVSEHLKNPSMEAIHNYFSTYYVPNNMAMVLVGDLDFDKTIALVNQTFGKFKSKEVSKPVLPKEVPLTDIIRKEVSGPTAESVSFAYRFEGIHSDDLKMVTLIDMILSNSQAGLIDLNLNNAQKVLRAGSYNTFLNDYGWHQLYGNPKEGQTLEEVEQLIVAEIEKVKKGEFEDWILEAVINDLEVSSIRQYESASATASSFYNAFIHNQNWQEEVDFNNSLRKITKEQIMKFAQEHYQNNYVVVYKRIGENSGIVKVDKPEITPVETNRDKSSPFLQKIQNMKTADVEPLFIDYKEKITSGKLGKHLTSSYIENPSNDLFTMIYVYEMGSENIKDLPLAISYLEFLGTDKYSPEEIKKEFYKLGINYGVSANDKRSYVYLSGLEKNKEKGIALFEHLLQNVKSDDEIYKNLVESQLKERTNNKTQKGYIFWNGLSGKAMYGEESPALHELTSAELQNAKPVHLVSMIQSLKKYPHEVFYYGKDKNFAKDIKKYHSLEKPSLDIPARKKPNLIEPSNKVFFVNYDMVQAEIGFLSKDIVFNKEDLPYIKVFNQYFGSGLSSIVFQEIRESKSLAYSAWSSYDSASEKDDTNLIYAYVGTQANKLPLAVDAMYELMNNLPYSEEQFNAAKNAALKEIQSERITKSSIFWNYKSNLDLGMDYDYRKEVYEKIKTITFKEVEAFFNQHIKGKKYNYIVIGNKNDVDLKSLEKLGTVEEVTIDELFVK